MSRYYVGIDGGGSKTRARLEAAGGEILAEAVGGPSNIHTYPEHAWDTIQQTLQIALDNANIKLNPKTELSVAAGLAGCEMVVARENFLALAPSFQYFTLVSDSYIACTGAHAGANGAIAIIGTGSVGVKLVDKQLTQVGGWGFPHDDQGSGAWLGWQALRATLQFSDGRLPSSSLLAHLRVSLGPEISSIVAWLHTAKPSQFAQLTPLIFDYAQQGDSYAEQLMKQAGQCIANLIEPLELAKSNLTCALLGGAVPFIEPYLPNQLKECLVAAQQDACWGALSLIRNR